MKWILVVLTTLFLTAGMAQAELSTPTSEVDMHSGGTDKRGCHHDRKRGGYHCH